MFTGLVDDVGRVSRVAPTDAGLELRIESRYDALLDGESIAVNGACLTVREHGAGWFVVSAVETTLQRTTLAEWKPGRRVNLERAVAVGDRLGGHIVQGHVDGVGAVASVRREGDATLVDILVPEDIAALVVPQGSIAVDGVSLTIAGEPGAHLVRVSLIEYTMRHTNLGELAAGGRVHIEADIVGKYVRRLLAPHLPVSGAPGDAGR